MMDLKNKITKVQDYSKDGLEIELSEIQNKNGETVYHLTITSDDSIDVDMSFKYQSSAEYYIMGFTRGYESGHKDGEKSGYENR